MFLEQTERMERLRGLSGGRERRTDFNSHVQAHRAVKRSNQWLEVYSKNLLTCDHSRKKAIRSD